MNTRYNKTPRELATGMITGDTKRDVYEVAGYPTSLSFNEFYSMFRRNAFAFAGVMRVVDKCWSSMPRVYDADPMAEGEKEPANTKFEREWNLLVEKGVLIALRGQYWRQRVGRYSGILVLAKDRTTSPDSKASPYGAQSVIAFRPAFENQLIPASFINDMSSAEFGNPETYNYRNDDAVDVDRQMQQKAITVHRSRVYVYSASADDGSIYGMSVLEPVFNDLLDLQKICAAGAEGHFKNAKQRIHIDVRDAALFGSMTKNENNNNKFKEKMKDFASGFDYELFTSGMDVKTIQSTLSDPTFPYNNSLTKLCAGLKIPKTVLIGFETGERSSDENAANFDETCNSYRINEINPQIKGFINFLIDNGYLSRPSNGIYIEWDDLTAQSDLEKLANAERMAAVNEKEFRSGNGPAFKTGEIRCAAGYEEEAEEDDEFDDGEMIDEEASDENSPAA